MLKQIDFDYNDLKIVIGPSTSTTYEINDDIKAKFETLPINVKDYIETRGENRHGIDLNVLMRYYLIIMVYHSTIYI